MQIRYIFLILLITNFSCETNKTVSDAEKDKIKGELGVIVTSIFKGFEEANLDFVMETWDDSPDFVFILNGRSSSYEEVKKGMGSFFSSVINQEVTIINEKYAVLDKSTVIYTSNCTFLENFKNGNVTLSDPMVMQFAFMKKEDKWKVINVVETAVRQEIKKNKNSD